MQANDFQQQASRYRTPMPHSIEAVGAMWAIGLAGETGEVCELIKKLHRDNETQLRAYPEFRVALTKELGDVLWYLSQLALDFGISLDVVMATNLAKLESRAQRGKLHGSGDDR